MRLVKRSVRLKSVAAMLAALGCVLATKATSHRAHAETGFVPVKNSVASIDDLKHVPDTDNPFRQSPPQRSQANISFRSMGSCSDFTYTESTDSITIDDGNSVLCYNGLGAFQHWFGRQHDLSVGDAAGQATLLECVTVGAEFNNQDITLTINAYVDDDGLQIPDTENMTLVGSTDLTFLLADGFPQLNTATFDSPVSLPPDTNLFIEIIVPEQRSPDTTPGFFTIGSNDAGQSSPSWIRTEASQCGLTNWVSTDDINAPSPMHIVESIGVSINNNFDPCDLPIPEECSADTTSIDQGPPDGVVSVPDFSLLLVEFGSTGDGSFRPLSDIAPPPNGDCQVDIQDFSALLIQWGDVCEPEITGACCYTPVGQTERSCQVVSETQCTTSLSGTYLGDDTTCDSDPCIEAIEQAWLNELHYDNAGADTGEFLEIYASSGLDPASVQVYLYNGNGGIIYEGPWSLSSDFVTGDSVGPGTLYYRNQTGIQNGSPDGILILIDGDVAQFLSYEGSFPATDGPAVGLNSTAIPIAEPGASAPGSSIGLTGAGSTYEDFSWTSFPTDSSGSANDGQNISP